MAADRYVFGDHVFDTRRGLLHGPGGPVPLRPKSYALLHHLLLNAGRLVGKDELMARVWPGVFVTDDSLTRCISEIRAAIGDHTQDAVKTVARRGYLFAAPVARGDAAPVASPDPAEAAMPTSPASGVPAGGAGSEAAGAVDPAAAERPALAPPRPGRIEGGRPLRGRARAAAVTAGALALAVVVALGGWLWRPTPIEAEAPPRLSLVVLPLTSDDPRGGSPDILAAAVTEALTISLSHLHGTTVIAPASAGTFGERPVDVREVGRALRVRYVVQGSALGRGDTVRIAARLHDTVDGRTLWSDQFDAPRGELLATQERIVVRLASALGVALVGAEAGRPPRGTASRPDAEALALGCESRTLALLAPDERCQQALALDPRNVRALVALALFHADRAERRQGPDPVLDQMQARGWVDRALAVEPADYAVQCALAVVLTGEHRVGEAVEAAERCRALNPSHAQAYRILAALHFFLAQPERTLADAERGMVLSPRDPQMAGFLLFKGWACFMMHRDDEAIVWLRRALAAKPGSATLLPPMISVLALTGRDDEARSLLARYRSLPNATAQTVSRWDGQPDDNPEFIAFGERFRSGLRRAGMPER